MLVFLCLFCFNYNAFGQNTDLKDQIITTWNSSFMDLKKIAGFPFFFPGLPNESPIVEKDAVLEKGLNYWAQEKINNGPGKAIEFLCTTSSLPKTAGLPASIKKEWFEKNIKVHYFFVAPKASATGQNKVSKLLLAIEKINAPSSDANNKLIGLYIFE